MAAERKEIRDPLLEVDVSDPLVVTTYLHKEQGIGSLTKAPTRASSSTIPDSFV